jgi:hypothetical protein
VSGTDAGAEDDPLVRPYILTAGREDRLTALDVASLVVAVGESARDTALEPEHLTLLSLCRSPQSIAELSARSQIPVALTKILVQDLLNRGYARSHSPAEPSADAGLLNSVLAGLQRL